MLKSILILFICLSVGEGLSAFFGLPIPGNVIGMLLLTAALQVGLVKLSDVQPAGDLLVKNLALFFVPPGVGLMAYMGVLRAEWIPILVSNVLGTLAVLVVVGWLQQKLE